MSGRWRRWRWVLLVALLPPTLLTLAAGGVVLAWRSPAVRQAALARAGAALEARTGVRLSAADVRLDPYAGVLELYDATAAVSGASPFLTLARLTLEVEPASLYRGAPVVRLLHLHSPRFDFAAPLPSPPGGESDAPAPTPPALVVERFGAFDVAVAGGAVPEVLRPYVTSWRIAALDVEGSYRAGTGQLALRAGEITVDLPSRGAQVLSLSLQAQATLKGPWAVTRFDLRGQGVELSGSAHGDFVPGGAQSARFQLLLNPSTIAPQWQLGGQVRAEGEVQAWPLRGEVRLAASGISGEAAHRLVPAELVRHLGLAATYLDLTASAQFELPTNAPSRAQGEASVLWRDRVESIFDATLVASMEGPAGRAEVKAEIFPQRPGRRHLRGRADLAHSFDPTATRLEGVTLEITEPDVAAAVAHLRRRWPALMPALPGTWPLGGGLDVTARVDGPVTDPQVEVHLRWRPGEGQELEGKGRARPATRSGEVQARLVTLELAPLLPGFSGTVSAQLHLAGNPRAYSARFTVDGARLGTTEPLLDYLHLAGSTDGRELRLDRLLALSGERTVEGFLRTPLSLPIAEAEADLFLHRPLPGVNGAHLRAQLREGALELEVPRLDTLTGPAWLSALIPLGALEPWLGEALQQAPLRRRPGPIWLWAALPTLDTCALAPLLAALDRPERVRAGVEVTLLVDPARPTAAIGEAKVSSLQVDGNGVQLAKAETAHLTLDGFRAVLAPLILTAAGTNLEAGGEASLSPTWRPGVDAPSDAVLAFSGRARGTVEAALLQPYLAGAAATGPVLLEAHLAGTPAAPRAGITVDASRATFSWLTPYAARLEGLTADAGITAAGDTLLAAAGRLNGGRLALLGSRGREGRSEVQVELAGARFRLDFGVLVDISGELVAELPPQGRSRVHGSLRVARGRLDRPLSWRHELLPFLLAPPTTAGTAGGTLDEIDLDIAVGTDDGVRVRNNLADLRVRWDELFIRGTAWSPSLEGVVSVDPGGLVRVGGQTLRLDRAVATFTGDPLTDPRLDLSVTSSLDDPSLGRTGAGVLALLEEDPGTAGKGLETVLTVAAAGAVGGTLASALSESLKGAARITVEPVLVFGEADPSARLTVARDVSPAVAFAVSLDLRNAGRQTYLLDLHNLPKLPRFTAQIFTNDQGNAGATVQQALELGGTRARAEALRPTLRRLVLEVPPEVPRRRLRRAVPLARGDPIPEGVEADLELELEHQMRQLGYPDAQVTVTAAAVARRRPTVDLRVQVDPGAPVAIAFAGEVPPAGARPLITSLYRSGLWEGGALEEMRLAAVRVWRSLGYLDPGVSVTVTEATAQQPRTITVTSKPGRRLEKLRQVQIAGVPAEVEGELKPTFAGTVELMELAAGLPDADRRLATALAALGYPRGRVTGRTFSEGEAVLTVTVEAGPRQHLKEVRFLGAPPEDLPTLAALAGLAPGDPARRDQAAAAAARIADWYRRRGYPEVRVRPELTSDPGDPLAQTLVLEVSPGSPWTVAGVELAGSPRTSPALARQLAAVPTRQPLRLDLVREGRRRLLATGLFRGVSAEVVRSEGGTATVRYLLDERPPVSLAYGVRWESTQGVSGVVDYLDRNLLGRALTFGARALYESTRQAGRLYLGAPDVLGTGLRSEAFLESRRQVTPGDDTLPELVEDSTRLTFQLSRPLGRNWLVRTYGRWQRTHLFERTDFFPLDITLTLPYLGAGLAYDSRDDRVQARRGVLFNLDLSGTGSALGADLAFGRLFAQVASFHPAGYLAGKPLTWAQSVRLGLARTGADQELIRSERFFAGGEYSVRGYPNESLGPVEDLGFTTRPLGGLALLVLNQELRLALPFDLTGLVFLDAGQVWEAISGMDPGDLAWACGLGVRAATPIGVLRLDAALPLHRRSTDPSLKLYLGFGSVF